MELWDINSGFTPAATPGMYLSSIKDILKCSRGFGITHSAMFNVGTFSLGIKYSNSLTIESCSIDNAITPIIYMMPPILPSESYSPVELKELINKHHVFCKTLPKSTGCYLCQWMYGPLLEILEQTQTPLILPASETDFRDLAKVKMEYPELLIIITGTTQQLHRQYFAILKAFKKTYVDTSLLIEYQGIEQICEIIGADRVLFGTGMPEKEPYDNVFALKNSNISDEEKQLIAHVNFEQILARRRL